ncbi:MAG: hypothetical protein NTY69_05595 [Methylococcales bacterium]|nr:hypothetical protein [Methylococcales bacterium]
MTGRLARVTDRLTTVTARLALSPANSEADAPSLAKTTSSFITSIANMMMGNVDSATTPTRLNALIAIYLSINLSFFSSFNKFSLFL